MMSVGEKFRDAMVEIYVQAWRECRYPAKRFLQMIQNQGAVPAVNTLLAKGAVSSGFTALWQCDRLDLTVEALVLKEPWSALFTEAELRIARQRLDDLESKPTL